MKRLPAGVLVLAALVAPPLAAEEASPALELDRQGQEALAAGDLPGARQLFKESWQLAREAGDRDGEALALFHLAAAAQLEGERIASSGAGTPGTDSPPPASFKESLAIYQRVLELEPESAATLHNMARVYLALGESAMAGRYFAAAATIEGPRRPFYLEKHVEFLLAAGELGTAARQLAAWSLAAARDPEPHERLLELFSGWQAKGAAPALAYLWRLVEEGQPLRAGESALDLLEDPGGIVFAAGEREELLAVVAAALARQSRGPRLIAGSAVGERLEELSGDEVVGPGAAELLRLFASPGEYEAGFPWWSRRGGDGGDPPRGVWPREAFSQAMRKVGRWYEHRDDFELAEVCFRTAATLAPAEPDPAAFRDLVELYTAHDQIDRLEELNQELSRNLFAGKGEAYRRGQLEKIYEYHVALGQIWGHLAKSGVLEWGNPDEPATPLFQLQRAVDVGRQLDQQRAEAADAGHEIHLKTGIVDLLAAGLEATGKDAAAVRTEAAERFRAAGKLEAAARVEAPTALKRIDASRLERKPVAGEPPAAAVERDGG